MQPGCILEIHADTVDFLDSKNGEVTAGGNSLPVYLPNPKSRSRIAFSSLSQCRSSRAALANPPD